LSTVFTRKNRFLPSDVALSQQLARGDRAARFRDGAAPRANPAQWESGSHGDSTEDFMTGANGSGRVARRPAPGEAAPPFEALSTDGRRISLADYRGRKLVLYFYPRDDTPGCTRQACSLRDHEAAIRAKGAAVLGVSTQDAASHRAFTGKYRLNFPLLVDRDGAIGRAYGVLGGAGLRARLRTALGLSERVTFVIDGEGRIAHVIDRPEVARHGEEVLALL
jgi:peroxiredoxin Q/BCP